MPKVQIIVEARGIVDIELTQEQIDGLPDAEEFPISLDALPVDMDDVLNQLDFEVEDVHIVQPRKKAASET